MVWVRLPPINVCGFSPFSSPLLSSATSAQWSVQCQERPQAGRDNVKTEENSFSSLRETFGLFELCDLVVLIVQWGSFQGTGVLSKFSNLAQSSVVNLFDKVSLVLKILLERSILESGPLAECINIINRARFSTFSAGVTAPLGFSPWTYSSPICLSLFTSTKLILDSLLHPSTRSGTQRRGPDLSVFVSDISFGQTYSLQVRLGVFAAFLILQKT